jgi:hypothetical protein
MILAFVCFELEEVVNSLSTGILGRKEKSFEKIEALVLAMKRIIFFSRFHV